MAMMALIVSARRGPFIEGWIVGRRETISLEEVDKEGGGWGLSLLWSMLPSRRSRMPLMIVRNNGAGFCEGEY